MVVLKVICILIALFIAVLASFCLVACANGKADMDDSFRWGIGAKNDLNKGDFEVIKDSNIEKED